MKLNKIYMLGLMASVALFTACNSDEDHEYDSPVQTAFQVRLLPFLLRWFPNLILSLFLQR